MTSTCQQLQPASDAHHARRAFTLVELAIVLAIVGLLAGGVLAGQSLIRAAEMRSVTSDFGAIQTAISSFRDKYFYLPGDMPNATQYWGIAGGSTGTDDACYTATNTSKATCNGNGNEQIDGAYSSTTAAERGHFWKQLANAGLITGTYVGYHGPYSAEIRRGGYNAKGSKITGTHWNVAYVALTNPASDSRFYDSANVNIIELTKDVNGAEVMRNIFTPGEQWNIDTKLDDGRPAIGTIRGPKQGYANDPNCTDSTAVSANYVLASKSKDCFPTIYLR